MIRFHLLKANRCSETNKQSGFSNSLLVQTY